MKRFYEFVYKHRLLFLITFIWATLCQGFLLLNGYVGIDTADALFTKGQSHYNVCLGMGRQWVVFLKFLTGNLIINPYVVGGLTLIFTWISSIIWSYLIVYISKKDDERMLSAFSFVLLSSPILTETFYFKVQSTEFAISFICVGLSLLWTHIFTEKKKMLYLIGAVVMMLVYMGTYQSFTPLYIAGAQICFLFMFWIRGNAESNGLFKSMWKYVATFACTFLAGFILNQVITRLFFSGDSYYDNLVHWQTESFTSCLYAVVKYIGRTLISNSKYYSAFCSLLLVILIGLSLGSFIRKRTKENFFVLFVTALLAIAPSYMAIILGGDIVVRTQVTYPFLMASVAAAVYILVKEKMLEKVPAARIFYIIIAIAVFLISYVQMCFALRLSYTDRMRNIADERLAHDIILEIEKFQNEDRSIPVFFAGAYYTDLNDSCLLGESIGRSMFAWDTETEPLGYFSSRRCINYIGLFGYKYNYVEDVTGLYEKCSALPSYPNPGYVSGENGVIMVNLGDKKDLNR